MRAVVLTGHGGTERLHYRTDLTMPHPTAGEVRVRVRASALNNTDIWTREGAYGLPGQPEAHAGWRGPITFPRIQGGDVVGVVSAVGSGVSESEWFGRRVLVDPAVYLNDSEQAPPVALLGSEFDGGFAEYVTVSADRVYDVTDSPLSDEQLACIPIAYGTATGMLERAALGAGETVLVTGASGGVGLALVQLAAARGATIVAVTTSAKSGQIREAGAAHVVHRDEDELAARIAELAPCGLDAVADVAGGSWLGDLMPLLRDDGRWVIAGAVAGVVVPFDVRRLYLHNLRLIGSSMHTRAHFGVLAELVREGRVSPRVAGRYSLASMPEAQQQFLGGEHVGKIVVVP